MKLFTYTDLSKLDESQKRQLVELHKKSLPGSPFSIMEVSLCTEIYSLVASNRDFFNSVAVFKGQPVGLCVGKTGYSTKKVFLPKKIYASYLKQIIMSREIFLYREFMQTLFLIFLKNRKSRKFWIELIFVDEAFKNLKIGSSLLNQYLNKVSDAHEIWVDSKKNNTAAVSFYLKYHFKKIKIPLLDSFLFVRK